MRNETWETFDVHFGDLDDPRSTINRRHQLLDMMVIAICAVLCGADDWEGVAEFGRAKAKWFAGFLPLPSGIPSHDTFWRVFRQLDGEQFEACFLRWVAEVAELSDGEVVAIDGKSVRRSHDREAAQDAIVLVSAWATENRLTLGQVQVAEKSNEITAIPRLLTALDLTDCIVTIDAIGCQKEIAAQIVAAEADYVLALKQNHGRLYADVTFLFEDLCESEFTAFAYDSTQEVDKGHGRIEIRQCWTIDDPTLFPHLRGALDWPALHCLVWIRSQRIQSDHRSIVDRYFISSLPGQAQQLLRAVRSHWQIENGCHWVLDLAFREDESRLRKGHSAHNFAILRRIALNLLKQDKTTKLGIKNKRLKAAWNHDYLFMLLSQLF
jgi:predicted transposase YbfD/YdcC